MDYDPRRWKRCPGCFWKEGGKCFNEAFGVVPRDNTGRVGHEITPKLLDQCEASDRGRKSSKEVSERLMRSLNDIINPPDLVVLGRLRRELYAPQESSREEDHETSVDASSSEFKSR